MGLGVKIPEVCPQLWEGSWTGKSEQGSLVGSLLALCGEWGLVGHITGGGWVGAWMLEFF